MCGLCFFRFSGNNKRVCRAHAAHSVAQCFPSTSILGIKCLLLPLRGEKAFPQLPTSWKLSPSPPPAPPPHVNKLLFFGTAGQLRSGWSVEGQSCWSVAASGLVSASPMAFSVSGASFSPSSFPGLPVYTPPSHLFLLNTCRCGSCCFLGTAVLLGGPAWWRGSPLPLLSSLLLPLPPSPPLADELLPFRARGRQAASLPGLHPS